MSDAQGWPERPGVPANPEVSGWHWLARPQGQPEPTEYRVLPDGDGYWWWNGSFVPSERIGKMAAHGLRYLGPCHTPAEVAALLDAARREAVAQEREEIAQMEDRAADGWRRLDPAIWGEDSSQLEELITGAERRAAAIRARGGA